MTTKSLKKITELLNRSEGISLTPIIVIMVLMSVMGGVFTSIMSNWKISAPMTINSKKAYYLAETAATFALQDAKYRFFSMNASGTPIFPSTSPIGERSSPFQVINTSTETAEFWIERPYRFAPPDNSTNSTVDLDRGNNDDDVDVTTLPDDDMTDDDDDDNTVNGATDVDGDGFSDVYTIIATGKVIRGGATVATRQIKINADITDNSASAIAPGVHTDGNIIGSGNNIGNCFGITDGTNSVGYETGTWVLATEDPSDPFDSDYVVADEAGLIFHSAPTLDKGAFKAMAIDQGHYHNTDLDVVAANDGYPNGFYYYDSPTDTMPNIIYLEGSTTDLKINAMRRGYGIYYVEGNVDLAGNGSEIHGIVICEGDITLGGTSEITGGLVHYGGVINGNGNPAAVTLDSTFFNFLNATITNINVQSWQEAVSAN